MESHIQHQSFTIKQLSNKELLSHTKLLVQKERNIHIQILHHLAEIDSRKLFFKQGFSSLFDYTVRELGYSEGAAYRRIKAMKLCQELPETANRLQSGRLSLSAASQLQVFFEKQDKKIKEEEKKQLTLKSSKQRVSESERQKPELEEEQDIKQKPEEDLLKKKGIQEKKLLKTGQNSQNCFQILDKAFSQNEKSGRNLTTHRSLSQEEKENLVQRAQGCSTRATERLLSEADPSFSLLTRREKVRFLGKGKVEIKMVIDEQCYKELEKLKNLLSHRNPKLSYGELISILSKEALKKHDPKEKNIREKKQEKIQKKSSFPKLELINKSAGLVTSARKFEKSKSSREASLSGRSVTSSRKSGQINQYSKEKATFAPKPKHQIKKISPSIPSHLRKYIWERDGGQCTYVHHETKRRCVSRYLLQIDHIQPFALGGRTEKENLRLLCAGHNQYRR